MYIHKFDPEMTFFKGENWKRKRKRSKFSACGGLKDNKRKEFIGFRMHAVRAAKIVGMRK